MDDAERRPTTFRTQLARSLRISLAVLALMLASLAAASGLVGDPADLPFLYDLFD